MNAKTWIGAALVVAAVVGLPLLAKRSAEPPAGTTPVAVQAAQAQAQAGASAGASAVGGLLGAGAWAGGTACADGSPASGGACGGANVGAPAPLPRFVDLGTTTCAPCKAMIRVMDELEKQFPDTLSVEFVNIKDNPDAMDHYGARMIPTQVFLSPDGIELFRHTGVFPAPAVIAKWKELGYDLVAMQDGRR